MIRFVQYMRFQVHTGVQNTPGYLTVSSDILRIIVLWFTLLEDGIRTRGRVKSLAEHIFELIFRRQVLNPVVILSAVVWIFFAARFKYIISRTNIAVSSRTRLLTNVKRLAWMGWCITNVKFEEHWCNSPFLWNFCL